MKEIPCNINAEGAVISAMMGDETAQRKAFERINTEDYFYRTAHKLIFRAISELHSENKTIDIITISTQLKDTKSLELAGGMLYLNELSDVVLSGANIDIHLDLIHESFIKRKIILITEKAMKQSYGLDNKKSIDILAELYSELNNIESRKKNSVKNTYDVCNKFLIDLETEILSNNSWSGVGVKPIDNFLPKIVGGHQMVIGARPGMGKSAFAEWLSWLLEQRNKKVLFCSLEMTSSEILSRRIARITGIDCEKIIKHPKMLTDEELGTITETATSMGDNLLIDDNGTQTIDYIENRILEHDPDVIIIDYLQQLSGQKQGQSHHHFYMEVMKQGKEIAKKYKVDIIWLSQLGRSVEQRNNKRPMLSDLKESGSIEESCDNVFFLYRPAYYTESKDDFTLEFICAKYRQGALGTGMLMFDPSKMKFGELDVNFKKETATNF